MWSTNNSVNNKENKLNQGLETLGMTSPISMAAPKEIDLVRTKELESALNTFGIFESAPELNHRMMVLGKLYFLVREWIKTVSIKCNLPESVAASVGGKVYTFGSYRLGVRNLTTYLHVLICPSLMNSIFIDGVATLHICLSFNADL